MGILTADLHMHACRHAYMHTCLLAYVRTFRHTCMHALHTRIDIHIHIHIIHICIKKHKIVDHVGPTQGVGEDARVL